MNPNRKHPVRCSICKGMTYRGSGICRDCAPAVDGKFIRGPRPKMPDPALFPEDFLMRCAEELMKRHRHRAEMLAKLGITSEAA